MTINWLFIRGLAREKRHWSYIPELFKKQFPNSTYLCLDIPGAGLRNRLSSPLTILEMAEDLRKQWSIEKENSNSWGIITLSLGGMIALQWASLYPKDFKYLVIANSSSSKLSPFYKRFKPKFALKLIGYSMSKDINKREKGILLSITNIHKNSIKLLPDWIKCSTMNPISKKNIFRQLWAANNFTLPKKIQPKLIILTANNDPLCDWTCSQKISEYYKVPLYIHPIAGHDIYADDSLWIISKIKKLINN